MAEVPTFDESIQEKLEDLVLQYRTSIEKTVDQAKTLAFTCEELRKTFDPQIILQIGKFRKAARFAAAKEGVRLGLEEAPEERLE
jgi:hypothetical protein